MSDDNASTVSPPATSPPSGSAGMHSEVSSPSAPSESEVSPVSTLDDIGQLGHDSFDDLVSGAEGPREDVAEPAAEEPPVAPSVEAPPQEAQPEQEAPSAPQASGPQTLDELIQVMGDKESDIIAAVAQSHFTLSPAQIEELETDAVGAVPKLLAQTHVRAVGTALNYIRNLVPGMIQRQVMEMAKAAEADRSFFQMWPGLSANKHGQDIITLARAMRAQNGKMATDVLMKQVGAAVMAMHGIQAPAARASVAPAAFRPAMPGVVRQTTPVQENPVEGLGREYE